jgi:hypothetical protein
LVFRCTDPRRDYNSFYGKKRIKRPRGKYNWKTIKANHKPSRCSPRDPENNEKLLEKMRDLVK